MVIKYRRYVTGEDLKEVVEEEVTRSIGVDSYLKNHILELQKNSKAYPLGINQLEVAFQSMQKWQETS